MKFTNPIQEHCLMTVPLFSGLSCMRCQSLLQSEKKRIFKHKYFLQKKVCAATRFSCKWNKQKHKYFHRKSKWSHENKLIRVVPKNHSSLFRVNSLHATKINYGDPLCASKIPDLFICAPFHAMALFGLVLSREQ